MSCICWPRACSILSHLPLHLREAQRQLARLQCVRSDLVMSGSGEAAPPLNELQVVRRQLADCEERLQECIRRIWNIEHYLDPRRCWAHSGNRSTQGKGQPHSKGQPHIDLGKGQPQPVGMGKGLPHSKGQLVDLGKGQLQPVGLGKGKPHSKGPAGIGKGQPERDSSTDSEADEAALGLAGCRAAARR
jgi:hypothetical protein